jgi:hypothetical protein
MPWHFLGATTQVMLRLANGTSPQALQPSDGERADLAQGTPVHAYLPADALRVLRGAPDRSAEMVAPLAS